MPLSAASLVTLAEAEAHLRSVPVADLADVQLKLNAATAIILDYIGSTEHWRTIAAAWTDETVPGYVHSAILLQLEYLFVYRGSNIDDRRTDVNELAPGVASLLRRTRDPVVA